MSVYDTVFREWLNIEKNPVFAIPVIEMKAHSLVLCQQRIGSLDLNNNHLKASKVESYHMLIGVLYQFLVIEKYPDPSIERPCASNPYCYRKIAFRIWGIEYLADVWN